MRHVSRVDQPRDWLACLVLFLRRPAVRGRWSFAVSTAVRLLSRRGHRAGAESRSVAGAVARARALGSRERAHALDGQRPHGHRAACDRRVRRGQAVRNGRQHDAVFPGHVSRNDGWTCQPPGRTTVERVGREHGEHALSGRVCRGFRRGGRASSEAQMGVRFSRRAQRRRAAHRCGWPRDGGNPERCGLCARRGNRLRPLVLSGGIRRARGRQHRPHRHPIRSALCGVRRRPRRNRVCIGRQDRRAPVEDEGRRSRLRPSHGFADVLQRPALCGRGLWRGNGRIHGRLSVLPIPRQPGRAQRRHGTTGVEDVHDRRGGVADGRRTAPARSYGGRRARPSGRVRRSTSDETRSMSRPGTTTPARPRRRATRLSPSTSNPGSSCGPDR